MCIRDSLIRGIHPEYEVRTNKISERMYWGEFNLETSDTGLPPIVLGRYLAGEIGAEPDDTVSLFILRGNTQSMSTAKPIAKQFEVAGLFETGMYDYDAILCYIPLHIAQALFNMDNQITGIQVRIENFYDANKIAQKIEANLGFPYYTVPWSETNKNLFSWMTLEKWGMFLVLALIIAVAAFNIISTLMMVVMEKTVDIGILKALGATKKSIVRIFLLQGVIVGSLGTIFGASLGMLLVWIQQHYKIISLPPDIYSISSLPMQLRFWDLIAVVALALILSILSSIYPAMRASRLSPVDAIRYG